MTKPIFSILLLSVSVLAQNTIVNGPGGISFLPGLSGNCTGVGNLPDVRIRGPLARRRQRGLQTNIIGVIDNTFEFTLEDIDDCCTGNGDFQFLKRYLQIEGIAGANEEEGFDLIPGNSLWTCTRECRSLNEITDKTFDECYRACFCRQNCPTSDDCLTADCKAACTFPEFSLEQDLCIDECDRLCGERCRSAYNGYVVPVDIYGEALKILDCFYGDLIGDQEGSCITAKAFWESTGHACTITEEEGLECNCIVPGTCFNQVFPCPYEFHCTSEAPSLMPSESPSVEPTPSPSMEPTKGKGKGKGKVKRKGKGKRPTDFPTFRPTKSPSEARATNSPIFKTTGIPTDSPSKNPSKGPTASPTEPLEMDDDDEDDDYKDKKGKDDDDDDWWKGKDDDDDWTGGKKQKGKKGKHKKKHDDDDDVYRRN